MSLEAEIMELLDNSVSLYTFVDISHVGYDISSFSSDFVYEYPKAISIGIHVPDDIVDDLNSPQGEWIYKKAYDDINQLLDKTATEVEDMIKNKGYAAKGVPASKILSEDKLVSYMSHKFVAHLGGLGWIGKSCLLITPEYGPRVRWATILTNAPLECNNKEMENQCNGCKLCVDICPSNAFNNVIFDKKDPRDVRYDAFKCFEYFNKLENENRPRLCGLCVKVCPYGLKKRD